MTEPASPRCPSVQRPGPRRRGGAAGLGPGHVVDEAAASLVSVLQGLATAGIWFAIVWLPILLVIGVVVGDRDLRSRDGSAMAGDARWTAAGPGSGRRRGIGSPARSAAVARCAGDRPG